MEITSFNKKEKESDVEEKEKEPAEAAEEDDEPPELEEVDEMPELEEVSESDPISAFAKENNVETPAPSAASTSTPVGPACSVSDAGFFSIKHLRKLLS